MHFPPALIYTSRFLKAEARTEQRFAGGRVLRTSFAGQAQLDDLFIRPGATLCPAADGAAGPVLLLPIVGGALLTTAHGPEIGLAPGFIYTIPAAEAAHLTLTNPFEDQTVNLLLIRATGLGAAHDSVQELELPLTAKNVLVTPPNQALPVRVGLYDSRVKDAVTGISPAVSALCYVLNGSFEIEDRLAEHRDALLLWSTPEVAFEALAETSLLLYLQLS